MKTATSRRLEAYVDEATAAQLMDVPPKPGTIVRTTARAEVGITEWTLSNGARVVLKPTTLREDQILFRATAPGGLSLASDADFPAVRIADQVVAAGGVGRFSAAALDRMLTGKAVAVSAFIGELEQGVGGGGTPEDLETMFQLLHLRFTQPRADAGAFAAFVSQAKGLLANQQASPDVVFNQTIEAEMSGNHLRRRPLALASVDQFDLAKSMAFYKARFADAGNFTFVFVGSFTPEMLKPLVETYVASLPATPATETWHDPGVPMPRGVVEKTVEQGIAPRSQVAIVFSGPFVYDDSNILALRAMTLVLESRLFDTIRQELGGTYSISADPGTQRFPQPAYTVRIQWACDPARTEALVKRVFDEIGFVRDSTYSPGQMTRIRAALLRNHEQQSQNNGYVLSEVARVYALGESDRIAAMLDLPSRIEALTGEALQRAAQTYLDTRNFVKVTQVPARQ